MVLFFIFLLISINNVAHLYVSRDRMNDHALREYKLCKYNSSKQIIIIKIYIILCKYLYYT